jgi:hypothetical protein
MKATINEDTYEAPAVQAVNTEDHPSVTAAGDTSDGVQP